MRKVLWVCDYFINFAVRCRGTINYVSFMRKLILCLVFCLCGRVASAGLADDIRALVEGVDGSLGVAIVCGDNVMTLGPETDYPLMSLFKLHVAVTALDKMRRCGISPYDTLYMEPRHMHRDTYSPLRERHGVCRVGLTYRDIIYYTLALSDNNTCDRLIEFIGGASAAQRHIRSLGIGPLTITDTERDMHRNIKNSYHNSSTPLAVVLLLRRLYAGSVLAPDHFALLEETLLGCRTGGDKLRAGLPPWVPLAHKTGNSDRTDGGVKIADVDAGVIYLPDGRRCYLAVMIKDSPDADSVNARLMADIAAAVYRHLDLNKNM